MIETVLIDMVRYYVIHQAILFIIKIIFHLFCVWGTKKAIEIAIDYCYEIKKGHNPDIKPFIKQRIFKKMKA